MAGKVIIFYLMLTGMVFTGIGCVTRTMNIETSPPNASVYIDDKYVGKSPVTVPFVHYGEREIRVEKMDEEGRLVLERKVAREDVEAPVYERFPLDFIFEVLLPVQLEDNHYFKYELEAFEGETSVDARKERALRNADELRVLADEGSS